MKRILHLVVAASASLCLPSLANAATTPPTSPEAREVIEAKAGELVLSLRMATNGIRVAGLRDITLNEQLLATNPLPLFSMTLRHAQTSQELRLTADRGWSHANVRQRRNALELQWTQPTNETMGAVSVFATATLDQRNSAFRWNFRVENATTNWGVWRVVFPQLAIADLGTDSAILFPRGPGEVQRGVWRRAFRYHGTIPEAGARCSSWRLTGKARSPPDFTSDARRFREHQGPRTKSDPATQNTRMAFDIPLPRWAAPK
jgi:hypothetical protein